MKEVNIYTAVYCTKKTGEGSFGYVLEFVTEKGKATGTKVEHFYGTENKGHILAVLHAVERLKESCHLTIYTESSYLATGYTNWIEKWVWQDWKNAKGTEIANATEWRQFYYALKGHEVEFKVKEPNEYFNWLKFETEKERKR